jgi:hypothetical protein
LCRAICKKVQAVVISVDYRLAPEVGRIVEWMGKQELDSDHFVG